MEKEIFSYCFSIKVKQKKWFYQVPQHHLNTITSRCRQTKGTTEPTEGNRNISSQQ